MPHPKLHKSSLVPSILVGIVLAIVGIALLQISLAATGAVIAEPEDVTPTVGATIVTDNTASQTQALQFGTPKPPSACEVPSAQVYQDQDDTMVPSWPRGDGEVVITFATGGLPQNYAGWVADGAQLWSESPCVEATTAAVCPGGDAICVPVTTAGGSDKLGTTFYEFQDDVRVGSRIELYTESLEQYDDATIRGTVIHEMGHAVGLAHRLSENVLMSPNASEDSVNEPDEIDYANLLVLYGDKI